MKALYILGTKINDISLNEAINLIANFLLTDQKNYITTPNPEICLISHKNKEFQTIINKSFISIPDGFGLKLGAWILGQKLINITTGADLCLQVLKLAEQKNYSILFFEGKPKIAERTLNLLNNKHPDLKIKYVDPGVIDKNGNFENSTLIEEINEYKPDIILTNFGAPKQEYFIAKNIDKIQTKIILGIGGSIDFIAGRIKRAPLFLRKLGLEWLWRLIQEPSRWPRIINAVIIFPLTCILFKFKKYE